MLSILGSPLGLWRTKFLFILSGLFRLCAGIAHFVRFGRQCASSGLVHDSPEARQARIVEGRTRRLDEHGYVRVTEDQNVQLIQTFIDSIDEDAVCALASRLVHGGLPCRIVDKKRGSFNICYFVEPGTRKEDSGCSKQPSRWVVRLPLGPAVVNPWEKIVNEVATVRYIQQKTRIPVPRIRAYGRDPRLIKNENMAEGIDNAREGQGYIISDFVDGASLDKKLLTTAEPERRHAFCAQMLSFLAGLRRLEFAKIGSLLPGNDDDETTTATLGPILSMSDNILRIPPTPVLAFSADYLRHGFAVTAEFFSDPIGQLEIEDARKELYVLHKLEPLFLGLVSRHLDHGPFILQHLDLRAHNILVDDQLRIQAVLDWEFTSTVPLPIFTPPSWITGHNAKDTRGVLHRDFRTVLHSKAKEDPLYQQLESEWYGEGGNEAPEKPLSIETTKRFCIAHILRQPSEAIEIFDDFLDTIDDPTCTTDEKKNARLARFFEDHPLLEVEAQRRCKQSQAYTRYLADNGLFESRMDRLIHMKEEMAAKYGWKKKQLNG
ncbi:phosphotransferase enzyme family protein [Niveomyces insectorum RCEF 264]|uniref:Phosphotransferase enzyme family protein n=1 Tax=Niveomyces insectorum RCEF 264 TaxID=1081102 RepID=A0A167WEY4_9HYPO|nr:phosphotransferase enzyme family protein [Niveomyces insectorum RCEF 264]